ncbi:MAG: excinuclease ABC subunit UvrB [Planctomycetes bacterium]|nr:excinuclease ABC subunit UvrB [Planctomycetota bacterium]
MAQFAIASPFEPTGDQPQAIKKLCQQINDGQKDNLLLGVTGSGKTFTMAKIIESLGRPTLIMAHNKTLATQLYGEFKDLFPHNAVEYFVSYYDYYQPEAYLPGRDLYIEKDASINKQLEKMRHSTTRSLLERKDVIIISSVSCIYGLGSPEEYEKMTIFLRVEEDFGLSRLQARLIEIQYTRNDTAPEAGQFRVRGDTIDIFPIYEDSTLIRVSFFGDEIESITIKDSLTLKTTGKMKKIEILPASHYVTDHDHLQKALISIRAELKAREDYLLGQNKLLEVQRLKERVRYDLDLMEQTGFCSGIENYSRHLTASAPGEPPPTLLDYLPDDALLFIDESHATIPQIRGMYNGDHSRKTTLVDFGFRLPSALDNRPLKFPEFEKKVRQSLYISATPGDYENDNSQKAVEQIIRPTGLIDPEIEIRPIDSQVEDLLAEILLRTPKKERILVTTLTKRMSEELTKYLSEKGVRVRYLHSDIDVLERSEIIRDLRKGLFDVLVGINLLREGLDIPEVSLVAILDADKEGFLRARNSLIQTIGRAARNINGKAILYGDTITPSMKFAIDETERRRKLQLAYNKKHKLTPKSIDSKIKDVLSSIYERDYFTVEVAEEAADYGLGEKEIRKKVAMMEKKMKKHASELEFEEAAKLRDEIKHLQDKLLEI